MLEAFSLSDKGCVRANNEDYCLIDAERGLYASWPTAWVSESRRTSVPAAVEAVAETIRTAPLLDPRYSSSPPKKPTAASSAAQNDPSWKDGTTTRRPPSNSKTNWPSPASATAAPTSSTTPDPRHHRRPDLGQRSRRPLGLDERALQSPMRHVLTMAIGASAPSPSITIASASPQQPRPHLQRRPARVSRPEMGASSRPARNSVPSRKAATISSSRQARRRPG